MSKAKKIILLFVISVFLSLSFSMHAFAAQWAMKVNVNQPRADEYSGYIEYLVNENGNIFPRVTFWHFARGTSSDPECFPEVRVTVSNHRIVLEAVIFDADPQQTHLYNWVVGTVNGEAAGSGSSYSSYSCENTFAINSYWNNNGQIMGYKIYGNGVDWASTLPAGSGTYSWSVMYSETSILYDAIISIAESSIGSSGSITQNATDNANKIQQNQNENTDKITSNNNANTDRIVQGQQQVQQNEIDKSNQNGNNASSSVQNAVEDKSSGFTSSLNNFVRGMSTSDTACKISMPAIAVPELQGLIPASVLSAESEVDFSQAVGLMPDSILKLVQALTTIALIIFCFKELYNTIEYVLTLKKGGGDS